MEKLSSGEGNNTADERSLENARRASPFRPAVWPGLTVPRERPLQGCRLSLSKQRASGTGATTPCPIQAAALPGRRKAGREDQRRAGPGGGKSAQPRHPQANTVCFHLPGGNKSLSSFRGRNCKSATLWVKMGGIRFNPVLHLPENEGPRHGGHLSAPCVPPFHRKSRTSRPSEYTSFVIAARFTNKAVGTGEPVVGRTDHP